MFPQKFYSLLFVAISLTSGLAPFSIQAQVDSMHGPFDQIYALYSELDPAYMPEGILFQSATPLVALGRFTGHHDPAEKYRPNIADYGATLFTVASAGRDTNRSPFFDLAFRDHYEFAATSNRVALTGVLVAGGWLIDSAYTRGQIDFSADSSQLVDGPNISTTAFRRDSLFFFAPTVERLGGTSVIWLFLDSAGAGSITMTARRPRRARMDVRRFEKVLACPQRGL